jgi:hypothetical protein
MDLDLDRIGFGSVVGMTAPQWRHAVVHSATALIITWTQTEYVSVQPNCIQNNTKSLNGRRSIHRLLRIARQTA